MVVNEDNLDYIGERITRLIKTKHPNASTYLKEIGMHASSVYRSLNERTIRIPTIIKIITPLNGKLYFEILSETEQAQIQRESQQQQRCIDELTKNNAIISTALDTAQKYIDKLEAEIKSLKSQNLNENEN